MSVPYLISHRSERLDVLALSKNSTENIEGHFEFIVVLLNELLDPCKRKGCIKNIGMVVHS